jgi:bacillithiol biosynthesis cysteine-adding enzyme BshC
VPANPTDHTPAAGSASTRISIDLRRFPWMRRLATDYAYDFPAVAPFYAGDPADPSAWTHLIRRSRSHLRPRREMAALIGAQQARRGAPQPAVAAACSLGHEDTVAVLTGQQAGLFGGPLFTLLKALTALQLAERVTREHAVPCVAVFWIDAEDHDWDEVRSCTVLDGSFVPHTIALPARGAHVASPVASVQLDGTVHDALDALEQALPPTEFRPELLSGLRAAYSAGVGMADAFGRWVEHLLGHRGLVVFDASDRAAKPLVSQLFGREVSSAGETARQAARAGSDLVARGYHAQVHTPHDTLSLFELTDGRHAIRVDNGHLVIGDRSVAPSDLAQEVVEHPTAFSPNVLLRPLVQDTLFPTVCYVAGPNELAYLGQLRGVYEHFGVPMPLIYPRASVTLLDASAMRFLSRYDVALETLQAQDEAALNGLLAAHIPDTVETAFAEASRAVAATMAVVIERIPGVDSTLETTARSTLGRMQHDLDALHAKMIQAAKRRDETLRRQFMRTKALAFPKGDAQERAIGFVSFLNQYGPALVDRLEQSLPLDLGQHWVITI